jgi:hypothetical protein
MGGLDAERWRMHGREWSISLTLPALSFSVFEHERGGLPAASTADEGRTIDGS